jgi:hypothetical protein
VNEIHEDFEWRGFRVWISSIGILGLSFVSALGRSVWAVIVIVAVRIIVTLKVIVILVYFLSRQVNENTPNLDLDQEFENVSIVSEIGLLDGISRVSEIAQLPNGLSENVN